MRVRRVSPLLLLLAPTLAIATRIPSSEHRISRREAQPDPELLDVQKARAPDPSVAARSTQTLRPYRGTEDAPVDGLDGKPHAGPFVDTTAEEARLKAGAATKPIENSKVPFLDKFAAGTDERWKLEDIPFRNDGVMNEKNRVGPKKGTDGTEGGISEKEKERKAQGNAEKKPQAPKEAPPLPHSEEEAMEEERQGLSSAKEGDGNAKSSKQSGAYGGYGPGFELPDDLPDKPHADPKAASKDSEPPVGSKDDSNPWLKDTMPYTLGTKKPTTKPASKSSPPSQLPASVPSESVGDDEDTWHEWVHSFVLSLTMILVSEIGDKTFLVAALMAMRHSSLLVFSAALSALVVMTILSAVLGHALPALLPKRLTTFAAAVLFLVFGAKMLREGLRMAHDAGVGEEMKEVEAELEEKEQSIAMTQSRSRRHSSMSAHALEAARGRQTKHKILPSELSPPSSRSPSPSLSSWRRASSELSGLFNLATLLLSPAWVQTFIMTFLGEWGDRSQIATIAMAAGQDYVWVTAGAVLGHACCTGVAVLGGRALAGRVSLRVVTIGGAVAFLLFGVIYLYESWTDS